jgi:ATP-dependent DNA helicase DinG
LTSPACGWRAASCRIVPSARIAANRGSAPEAALGYSAPQMDELAEIFRPDGVLASELPGFNYREPQERMARLVAQAIDTGRHAVIEAGTGIGKTFAYLLPVLLSGRRAIISTGTRTLQDQLFSRDLPLLGAAVGRPVEVALLKGRNNYLCWHRLDRSLRDGFQDASSYAELRALDAWGKASASGDLTELQDFPENHPLRAVVTSTAENCLGAKCAFHDRCFVLEARRRAQQAQVVIVNHHLLLADLALKEGGFGELLPGADAVVVDEAHQLPEIAQQFFGLAVGTRETELLLRDIASEAAVAGVARHFHSVLDTVARAVGAVRAAAGTTVGKLPWITAPAALRDALPELAAPLEALQGTLAAAASASEGLLQCLERATRRDAVGGSG